MPIDRRLLEILCCPATRVALRPVDREGLDRLNQQIRQGDVRRIDGTVQVDDLQEALITVDAQRIYRIDDGIPVLLADEGIAGSQFPEFR